MKKSLQTLLEHPALWQASRSLRPRAALSTGFEALDQGLHDRGWPLAATTELLISQTGIGELRLLLPALKRCQTHKPWIVFLAPPFLPYLPSLAAAGIDAHRILVLKPRNARESLWCADQVLRSGTCAALINWACQTAIGNRDLRMLQQAAHQGDCWHVLFRHQREAQQASPSALRVELKSGQAQQLTLKILKQRGGWSGQDVSIQFAALSETPIAIEQLPVHLSSLPNLRHQPKLAPSTVTLLSSVSP